MVEMEGTVRRAKREFFMCPNEIFNVGLSAYSIATYSYLCMYMEEHNYEFPDDEKIMKACGIRNSSAVSDALKELESKGIIN